MEMRPTSRRRDTLLTVTRLLSLLLVLPASAAAQSGVIAGSVTADQGVVRAFRVKARDTVHRISYTVYTVAYVNRQREIGHAEGPTFGWSVC